MFRILENGSTGLAVQQIRMDVIAKNLVNESTAGYKKQGVFFADLLYQNAGPEGRPIEIVSPSDVLQGGGVLVVSASRDFSQSQIINTTRIVDVGTNRTLDLAIQGKGFFMVELPDGTQGFTRNGSFHFDASDRLVNENGFALSPSFDLPPGCRTVNVCPDGKIIATDGNLSEEAGEIALYEFNNADGLEAVGENLFVPTEASGQPLEKKPGEAETGVLCQGSLEASNVELVDEMSGILEAQRAYLVALRLISNGNEMWSMANDLRK